MCLRHPTNALSREIRSTIVELMKKGLEEIVDIVCYAASANTDDHEKTLCRAFSEHLVSILCLWNKYVYVHNLSKCMSM